MNLEVIAITLETFGTVLIAFVALNVHHRMLKDKSIDKKVINTMKQEQVVGGFGVLLVISGYLVMLIEKL